MRARLIVETGAASPQMSVLREKDVLRLGRNGKNNLVVDDPHASRFHAEVYYNTDRWYIKDCDTTNGTRVNGIKIHEPAWLENNHVITIGDVRLRFTLDTSAEGTAEIPVVVAPPAHTPPALPGGSGTDLQTILHADELTALLNFMTGSLAETTLYGLVHLALSTVHKQTLATMAGFLSFDADEPHFRITLPTEAPVDHQLSRQLTQKVLREMRTVWLGADQGKGLDSESLVAFRDALCIPLRIGQVPQPKSEAVTNGHPKGRKTVVETEPPAASLLGALHVYRSNRLFGEREVRFCEVLAGCLAGTLHVLRARRALEADNSRLRDHGASPCDELIGDSQPMRQLRQQITQFARLPCTLLIAGESGVGKELVALSLHRQSPRREGPLVPLNCAAIPSTLAESELFGHEEGAFSGASRERLGAFLRADQGTLFLDEIGEMSLGDQAKLLRVLETKSLCPVGGDENIQVDVRIVAATNRDLKRQMQEGHFRKDLYFRLGTTIHVPALREHLEDIPALVEHFLNRFAVEYRRRMTVSPAALERLQQYPWPGNVRQLRSVLETAVATTEGEVIQVRHLHLDDPPGLVTEQPQSLNLKDLEAWAIRQALAQTGGNKTQAARILGIHRDTLISKLKDEGSS
jgi:two-component system response regulator HydG